MNGELAAGAEVEQVGSVDLGESSTGETNLGAGIAGGGPRDIERGLKVHASGASLGSGRQRVTSDRIDTIGSRDGSRGGGEELNLASECGGRHGESADRAEVRRGAGGLDRDTLLSRDEDATAKVGRDRRGTDQVPEETAGHGLVAVLEPYEAVGGVDRERGGGRERGRDVGDDVHLAEVRVDLHHVVGLEEHVATGKDVEVAVGQDVHALADGHLDGTGARLHEEVLIGLDLEQIVEEEVDVRVGAHLNVASLTGQRVELDLLAGVKVQGGRRVDLDRRGGVGGRDLNVIERRHGDAVHGRERHLATADELDVARERLRGDGSDGGRDGDVGTAHLDVGGTRGRNRAGSDGRDRNVRALAGGRDVELGTVAVRGGELNGAGLRREGDRVVRLCDDVLERREALRARLDVGRHGVGLRQVGRRPFDGAGRCRERGGALAVEHNVVATDVGGREQVNVLGRAGERHLRARETGRHGAEDVEARGGRAGRERHGARGLGGGNVRVALRRETRNLGGHVLAGLVRVDVDRVRVGSDRRSADRVDLQRRAAELEARVEERVRRADVDRGGEHLQLRRVALDGARIDLDAGRRRAVGGERHLRAGNRDDRRRVVGEERNVAGGRGRERVASGKVDVLVRKVVERIGGRQRHGVERLEEHRAGLSAGRYDGRVGGREGQRALALRNDDSLVLRLELGVANRRHGVLREAGTGAGEREGAIGVPRRVGTRVDVDVSDGGRDGDRDLVGVGDSRQGVHAQRRAGRGRERTRGSREEAGADLRVAAGGNVRDRRSLEDRVTGRGRELNVLLRKNECAVVTGERHAGGGARDCQRAAGNEAELCVARIDENGTARTGGRQCRERDSG